MHSVTSFLDFQILELIHFQKNFQGRARQSQGGVNAPPRPPERNPASNINFIKAMTYNQVHYFQVDHLADFTQNGHTKIPVG